MTEAKSQKRNRARREESMAYLRMKLEKATKWTQLAPSSPGMYLRVNAGHSISRETVMRIDGKLMIHWGWGSDRNFVPVSNSGISKASWWWFGPIPAPPKEADVNLIYEVGKPKGAKR